MYHEIHKIDLRASDRRGRIAERYRSPELAIARLFIEDVVSHLGAGRLNSILVEIGDSSNLTFTVSGCLCC